jgi:hypothetical protein
MPPGTLAAYSQLSGAERAALASLASDPLDGVSTLLKEQSAGREDAIDLLYGKWADPVAGCLAVHAADARGGRSSR